jgi:hypothetical protein
MAKHYYNIEVVTSEFFDEEAIEDLEELVKRFAGDWAKVSIEYVDSEG